MNRLVKADFTVRNKMIDFKISPLEFENNSRYYMGFKKTNNRNYRNFYYKFQPFIKNSMEV